MNTLEADPAKAEEQQIIQEALDVLARTTGLQGEVDAAQRRANDTVRQPDAHIRITNNGRQHRYTVEVKRAVDRREVLNHVQHQLLDYGGRGLLITALLTPELAKHCRDVLDLQFIDTAGNAYLRAPGLYVYIRGEREPLFDLGTTANRGGGTNTALRVIFALLCRPELLNAPYREIHRAAHVALGAVGWVFFDLEKRGLVVGRKGNRRFLYPGRLLEEFIATYPLKFRPKLVIPLRLKAQNPDWWRTATLDKYHAAWGGEVAADRLTENREPGKFTVYLPGDPAKFILENRLRADPDGNIEIVKRFWQFDLDPPFPKDLAPPLLIYADLMATPDPRNHDTAKQLYDRYLANAFHKT